jgi:hypothetical protein
MPLREKPVSQIFREDAVKALRFGLSEFIRIVPRTPHAAINRECASEHESQKQNRPSPADGNRALVYGNEDAESEQEENESR